MEEYLKHNSLEITNDTRILATAIDCCNDIIKDNFYFFTNDLALKRIASLYFEEDHVLSINEYEKDEYTGYLEL
jgi:hypothetical protein